MNFNIDRFTAVLPPIEHRPPPAAAPDRDRQDASFDRRLEEVRRQPVERESRPAADRPSRAEVDRGARPPADSASTRQDGTTASQRTETSNDRTNASPVDESAEASQSSDEAADAADDSAGDHTKADRVEANDAQTADPDASVVEAGIVDAIAAAGAANLQGAADSDVIDTDDGPAQEISKKDTDAARANAKRTRRASAVVAATSRADVSTPAGDATARAAAEAAAGEAQVATTASAADAEAEGHSKPGAADKAIAREANHGSPRKAAGPADVAVADGPVVAAASKTQRTTSADAVAADERPATTTADANSGPRRTRTAKTADGQRGAAHEIKPDVPATVVSSPAEAVREAAIEALATTTDETARDTRERSDEKPGPTDAPSGQTSAAPTGNNPIDAPTGPAPRPGLNAAAARTAGSAMEKKPAAAESERVRFVQRVAKAFQSAADRGGPVRLRLSPPELGSLRLEITVRNGAMTARLEAETPAARTLLLEGLPALRERLAQQDLKMDRFDVELMGQPQGGSPQTHDDAAYADRRPAPSPRRGVETSQEIAPSGAAAATQRQRDGRLNVLI